jgi:FAD/FMN-containing dehydrogenase
MDLGGLLDVGEAPLGLVTRPPLALEPLPVERLALGWRVPSFAAAVAFAVACRRTGIRATCLEAGTDDEETTVHLVVDGLRGEARIRADRAAALAAAAGGTPLPEPEASAWWAERHAIGERWAASSGFREGDWLSDPARAHFDYAHVAVPLAKLPDVRRETAAVARAHAVRLVEEGLWHWPELYSIVVVGPGDGVRATVEAACRAAQEAGGAMEYCHGVGWKLAHLMAAEHGETLAVMRRVKTALDPAGILNPGKAGL